MPNKISSRDAGSRKLSDIRITKKNNIVLQERTSSVYGTGHHFTTQRISQQMYHMYHVMLTILRMDKTSSPIICEKPVRKRMQYVRRYTAILWPYTVLSFCLHRLWTLFPCSKFLSWSNKFDFYNLDVSLTIDWCFL